MSELTLMVVPFVASKIYNIARIPRITVTGKLYEHFLCDYKLTFAESFHSQHKNNDSVSVVAR